MVPLRIETILISAQHNQDFTNQLIKKDITKYVIQPVIDYIIIIFSSKF